MPQHRLKRHGIAGIATLHFLLWRSLVCRPTCLPGGPIEGEMDCHQAHNTCICILGSLYERCSCVMRHIFGEIPQQRGEALPSPSPSCHQKDFTLLLPHGMSSVSMSLLKHETQAFSIATMQRFKCIRSKIGHVLNELI